MPSSLSEKIAFINRKRELEQALETGTKSIEDSQEVQEPTASSVFEKSEVFEKASPDIDVSVIETKDIQEIKKVLCNLDKKIDKIYEGLKSLGAIQETKVKKGKK